MILRTILQNKVTNFRTYCSGSKVDWTAKSVYPWFLPVQTRWKDNDQFGHMNNAVYHAIFDSIINIYLIRYSRSESGGGPIGFMVHTECDYVKPIAYPEVYL